MKKVISIIVVLVLLMATTQKSFAQQISKKDSLSYAAYEAQSKMLKNFLASWEFKELSNGIGFGSNGWKFTTKGGHKIYIYPIILNEISTSQTQIKISMSTCIDHDTRADINIIEIDEKGINVPLFTYDMTLYTDGSVRISVKNKAGEEKMFYVE